MSSGRQLKTPIKKKVQVSVLIYNTSVLTVV